MKHSLLFVCLFVSFNLSAQLQEFHVTERDQDGTSVVQANTEYPDNAMILVYSDLEGLDFRSSVGGINQQRYNARANRYEILVSPQRQILFVAARGFIEQRIALINPEPKDVYFFQVEERRGQDEISVFFNVEPNDAALFVDNIPIEINKTVSVPSGPVTIRLEKEGYSPIKQFIEITPTKVNYTFKMREVELEAVQFRTNVEGARVVIDGMERGQTSSSFSMSAFLYPGDYTVEVQKNKHLSHTQTVVVEEGEQNVFDFELERNTGVVAIKVQPPNAEIMVNRSPIGKKRELELAPGRYRIDFDLPNYTPHSENIDVTRGEHYEIDVNMTPLTGNLKFTVSPDNAEVILRNEQGEEVKRWVGLKIVRDLQVGQYEVEVRALGYRTQRKNLFIEQNERTPLRVDLDRIGSEQQTQEQYRTSSTIDLGAGKPFRSIMLTFLPHQNPEGVSLRNSNFGLHFTYAPKKIGFYVVLASSFNFSSTNFEYKDERVQVINGTAPAPESGAFLPDANIRSNEIGGGLVYRFANLTFMAGMSYYNYQFRQRFDVGALDNPYVLISDRSFSDLIPKVGLHADINGFALGVSFGAYHPTAFASMLMLGIAF